MEKKKRLILIWSGVAVCLAIAVVAAVLLYQKYYDRKMPNFGKVSEIYVYPDTPKDSLEAMILRKSEVLKPKSLHRAFKELDTLKAGHYTITKENTSMYVVRMFSHGWQTPVNLVLSGTIRRESVLAKKISRQMLIDSADVMEALHDTALLASLGVEPSQRFALFIPDTYQVLWTTSMPDLLRRMRREYDAFWNETRQKQAESIGLTPKEVSILASIVNGETNYIPEMNSVAGVYVNRLMKGMKLQADPTVAYCYDYQLNRILKVHTKVDSPFNTYRYYGLPPAPICVPTKPAMDAVLNYDKSRYLYFCASPELNGRHRFAATYSEHLKNAKAFHRALTQKLKEKKKAQEASK